jgi:hypothetical protein
MDVLVGKYRVRRVELCTVEAIAGDSSDTLKMATTMTETCRYK